MKKLGWCSIVYSKSGEPFGILKLLIVVAMEVQIDYIGLHGIWLLEVFLLRCFIAE